MDGQVFSPSDFVAVFNQTLEYAYPSVVIEGELANFRIAKNRWVYFSLQDELASVSFFGAVNQLPGPLEDGLMARVVGVPRMHPRYGFSVNLLSITPVGEGALRKAGDLLAKKLAAEGLFAPERKRPLPALPERVGLITAAGSAAAADFIKILGERWGGLEILLRDSFVQGPQAPASINEAVDYFNRTAAVPDVLVITRGGGGADDLAAFNDERVVRVVAASRAPTLVAIGHEVDISLAELAADQRASTPSNAAQLLVPDKKHVLRDLDGFRGNLQRTLKTNLEREADAIEYNREYLRNRVTQLLNSWRAELSATRKLVQIFDPEAALKRGYAIVTKGAQHVDSITQVSPGDNLSVRVRDGTIGATVSGRSR